MSWDRAETYIKKSLLFCYFFISKSQIEKLSKCSFSSPLLFLQMYFPFKASNHSQRLAFSREILCDSWIDTFLNLDLSLNFPVRMSKMSCMEKWKKKPRLQKMEKYIVQLQMDNRLKIASTSCLRFMLVEQQFYCNFQSHLRSYFAANI